MKTTRPEPSACRVCGIRTYATRTPRAHTCSRCGQALCDAHAHYYVDGNSGAITRAALAACGTCTGLLRAACLFAECRHVAEGRTASAIANGLRWHIGRQHG